MIVGCFGQIENLRELGKKGTSSDITLYNYKQGDKIVSYVEPTRYPDKIAPLIYTINMMDYALVFIKELTGELGETLLALDMAKVKHGSFVLGDYVDEDLFNQVIKGTSMKNFDILPWNFIEIREKIINLDIERDFSYTKIPIDHHFKVKSVGTVVLGKVEKGIVKVHDTLKIYPIDKEVLIKSIQIHDNNVNEAKAGDRVGLALKGVDSEEIGRGYILTNKDIEVYDEIKLNVEWNPFKERDINVGETYQIICNLQYVSCTVEDKDEVKLKLNKPIAYDNELIWLLDGSAKIRILGVGKIKKG
ncbi:elongation factor Tu domain 2 protein [Methanocaldococcus infernus ME]|uniref:Elongation factor Tu domain 2 protein n=1 Tax=Methanocaldococcus infernus (strain DSM 11812 / JCM 15783 / ME) TaxID=573063 RepID=D5VST3_METIM|nr:EF-Tu/IF-2/RF-3 family GTPase [Methanocaldococcus infernus]ADG13636.1 elongation factor Tu domain 2 protein [Methanocaldococcus infernus ME]